ncbi:MAG TPA: HEAT repeat domain-containing protein [Armatimonadota bacterium]|nr:HEAT repeat domain-containing protein [Armatimonadota bacterium]
MKLQLKCLCSMAMLTIVILFSAMSSGQCDGFTDDTELSVTLQEMNIQRFIWEATNGFDNLMPGTVELLSGHGTEPTDNKVMLYGDRSNPLYEGEPDWHMDPYPTNIYLTDTQTLYNFDFPFGPNYRPPEYTEWMQIYIYSACVNLANGNSTNSGTYLAVNDSLVSIDPTMSASTMTATTTTATTTSTETMTTDTSSLLTALQDTNTTVRVKAALALANSTDIRAEEPLRTALADREADVRWAAAYALGKHQDTLALPTLLYMLSSDPDADARASAATALGAMITEPNVLSALINASEDVSPYVRQAVLHALGHTSDTAAIATFKTAVNDTDLANRLTAIAMLGRKRVLSADSTLISILQTRGVEERREAALALGSLGTPNAINALVAALQDSDVTVQKAAALSLGVLKDSHITTDIATLYQDYYSAIRK